MSKSKKNRIRSKDQDGATKEINSQPGKSRIIVFWSILILIPLVFFVMLEVILIITDYGENTDLFVDTLDKEQKIYLNINPDVARRYFSYNDFVPSPRVNLFLKQKPEGSYRIFVMGGSTAAGYPYGNNLDLGRILNRKLSDTFPNKKIEVVNTALTAVNSYTIWDFMDEVIEQKPDAILIYAGHNEFYGALGVASMESLGKYSIFVRTFLKLQRFRTFLLLRDMITYFRQVFAGNQNIHSVKKEETAMAKLAKDQLVALDSDDYQKGKSQFRENLSAIVEIAKEQGVHVILSELVSNIKDHRPFSKDSDARDIFSQALNAEREGDYARARELYYQAKDYDAIRFRASEDFNEIIQEIAVSHDLPVVPVKSYFEKESKHGLVGNNLMHEHLHPKKEGYFLMADAFYDTMKKNKFISDKWPSIRKNYSRDWGMTDLDSVYAHMSIVHLKGDWPFVQSGKENNALEKTPKLNYVDSLAYKIHLDEELTLEGGHLDLGRYYEQRGAYRKALEEYIALIYQMPNADAFYEPAVKLLSNTRNYRYAVNLLTDALKYHKSTLMYSWIGQFSSALGNYQQAKKYLELGIKDRPRDILVLYHLAMSYYKLKMIEKGDRTLRKLEMINPSLKQVAQLKQLRNSMFSIQN